MPTPEIILNNTKKNPRNFVKLDNETFLKFMLEEGYSESDYEHL